MRPAQQFPPVSPLTRPGEKHLLTFKKQRLERIVSEKFERNPEKSQISPFKIKTGGSKKSVRQITLIQDLSGLYEERFIRRELG